MTTQPNVNHPPVQLAKSPHPYACIHVSILPNYWLLARAPNHTPPRVQNGSHTILFLRD
ncbi:hypothetical protein CCACVL1_26559 [Corchorus capsularis]|uniref:Uncharacterized protein n=1 Tax=Corchorus capsularis TaxID=210143 RepID=A0A1R3GEB6_COCAP|nr:hypothetical protein CCACVL1_26559 [Corchorus capsularis]